MLGVGVTFDGGSILCTGFGRVRLIKLFFLFCPQTLEIKNFDFKVPSLFFFYCWMLCCKITGGPTPGFLSPPLGRWAGSGSEINEEVGGNFFGVAVDSFMLWIIEVVCSINIPVHLKLIWPVTEAGCLDITAPGG